MTKFQPPMAWLGSLLAIGLALSTAFAQPKPALPSDSGPRGQVVALLDVGHVFANYTRMKTLMAEVKADAARAEAQMKREADVIRKLTEKLEGLSEGPDEAAESKAIEEEIAKRKADLQVRLQLQRKELLEREGKIYHAMYEEIRRAVEEYAKKSKISVVLRFHGVPANVQKPDEVVRYVNRPVVWSDKGLDITPVILAELNERAGRSGPEAVAQQGPEKPGAEEGDSKPSSPKSAEPKPAAPKPDRAKADTPKPSPGNKQKAAPNEQAKGREGRAKKPAIQAEPKPAKSKPSGAASPKPKPGDEPSGSVKRTVVRLTMRGTYAEGPTSMGLFGDIRPSLATIVRRMDQAQEDDDVAAVLLRIEGLDLGRGKVHELRAAIARLRKSGKPVYAQLTSAGTSQYLLAAACDEVVIVPNGALMLPGVRAEATFFKGLLDKLGIQFDVLQMGKYKGGSESLTRTKMSRPFRRSLEALVDDTYEDLVATIAKDRSLEPDEVKAIIDRGILTAQAAQEAGLVDHVAYPDEVPETLRKKLKTDAVRVVDDYRRKKPDTDFSGLTGLVKLMQLMMGGQPEAKDTGKQKIAVVYAVGMIISGKSTTSLFGEQAVGSTTLVQALRAAAQDPKVAAIVLRIDSPGGSAVASDLIWREVVRTKKPIIASMGDVAGSGGYYIAMGADKILAAPDTVTGSIGVLGGKLVLGGLFDKIGITTEVISRGKNSGASSSTQPFTKDERQAWMALLQEIYDQFAAKAAEGRNMPRKKLEKLAQGRVYTGRMAAANGLIDGLGTLDDAILEAKKAAGLNPDDEVELLILPRPKTIFEQLLGEPWAAVSLETTAPPLKETLAQVELLRRLFSEPALTLMPCRIRLK